MNFYFVVRSTANRHLLRAMARVGAGSAEFFDNKVKSKWESKVRKLLPCNVFTTYIAPGSCWVVKYDQEVTNASKNSSLAAFYFAYLSLKARRMVLLVFFC